MKILHTCSGSGFIVLYQDGPDKGIAASPVIVFATIEGDPHPTRTTNRVVPLVSNDQGELGLPAHAYVVTSIDCMRDQLRRQAVQALVAPEQEQEQVN